MNISDLTFDKNELIPAVIQDTDTLQILMVGWMNETSIQQTIELKKVVFWSRSRQELWLKGSTSGNFLNLVSIKVDCDQDTLLIKVKPDGPTCHTGNISCFFTDFNKIGEN
jgi:phosphoribosyl-AMP cyclohydrolase